MIDAQETARSEGIRALFGQSGPILWANVGVGVIVVGTLWDSALQGRLLLWLAALTLLTTVRAAFQRRYFEARPGVAEVESWGRRFVVGSSLSGMLWGTAGVLFFDPSSALGQALLAFAIGGMTAAAASALAPHLPAFFGFSVFALGPFTIRVLAEGDRIHLGMGAMVIAYALGMQRVARNNHESFVRAFELGIKNTELLEQVSAHTRTLEQRVLERTVELERQGEELRKAQRLELAGRLAGGLAHDFNSLLTVVLNNAALLKESRALDEHGRLAAAEMQEAAQRGAALIRQLLAFGGPRQPQPRTLALDELIGEWATLLRLILGEAMTVEVKADASAAYVSADPVHVEQVLVNLVASARSAVPGGGRLLIATRVVALPEGAELPAGEYVELQIAASGEASSPRDPHPFTPYFLVEGDAREPGAALASVQSIVETWRGRVQVHEPGAPGARFRVLIPALPRLAPSPSLSPSAPKHRARRATILVVDDEPTLRSVIRRSLTREGFDVLVAEDGERALSLAKTHQASVSLLITDVVMPGMSGPELAKRLRQVQPALGVLLISGYTFEETLPVPGGSHAIAYLSKPFDTRTLIDKVHALLDAVLGDQRAAVDREGAAGDPGAVVTGQEQRKARDIGG